MSNLATQREDLFKMFSEIPPETKLAYRKCVHGEAFFKFAVPFGAFGAGLSYLKIGRSGAGTVVLMALAGYVVGLTKYTSVCLQRHAPHMAALMNNFYQGTKQNIDLRVGDESVDQEPTWNSFNTPTIDNDNQFHMDSIFEEDTKTDKPVDSKPRLTYDDLLKEHRSGYNTSPQKWYQEGYKPVNRPPLKRDEEILEDTFKPETKEDDIWI